MSKIAVEHTITLVTEVELDKLSDSHRAIVENFTEHEREQFFTELSISVIGDVLPKVNAKGTYAFLRLK
jgi:hypothetical protein